MVTSRSRLRLPHAVASPRLDLLEKQQAIDHLRTTVAVTEASLRANAGDLAKVRSFRLAVIDGVVAFGVIAFAGWVVMRYRARTVRLQRAVSQALKTTSSSL